MRCVCIRNRSVPRTLRRLTREPASGARDALVREWSFDAAGPALNRRPAASWNKAALALRLTTAGTTHEEQVEQPAGEPWNSERPGRVTMALDYTRTEKESPPARNTDVENFVSVDAADAITGAALPVVADAERGWIRIDLDGVTKQGDANNRIERIRLNLRNTASQERPVRLLFDKTRDLPITGMSAILRDRNGFPTGIPVQLSKNWHRSENRRLIYEGPWFHGFTLLRLPAQADVELELVMIGAHWGGVAAASHAQLCLVGWGSNQLWDQTAVGSWGESFCFEPDRAQADALVCDVRPLMVSAMNHDIPTKWTWTNNVGGGDAFRLFTLDGRYVRPRGMKTAYIRHGPCLTEVTYAGTLADGAVEHSTTVSLYRTDDMARCIYQLRFDVQQAVEFSRFVILQIGADTYGYTRERKMAVGNEDGMTREWDTVWGGDRYRTDPMLLAGRVPWVSLHEAVSQDRSPFGAWANRGLVIRCWRARLSGEACGPWLAEHGVSARGHETSTVDILPPPGTTRLEPGDFVEATIEHIVVPQFARDYYGPNEALRAALHQSENTWRMLMREAVRNDVAVAATVGRVERQRPLVVRAEGDRAEFALTGGAGYVPITICGLSTFRARDLTCGFPTTAGSK